MTVKSKIHQKNASDFASTKGGVMLGVGLCFDRPIFHAIKSARERALDHLPGVSSDSADKVLSVKGMAETEELLRGCRLSTWSLIKVPEICPSANQALFPTFYVQVRLLLSPL